MTMDDYEELVFSPYYNDLMGPQLWLKATNGDFVNLALVPYSHVIAVAGEQITRLQQRIAELETQVKDAGESG